MSVRPLADCDATCGGKAHGLARAIAAGLHVPDGFVIEPSVFRTIVGDRRPLDEAGHALDRALDRALRGDLPRELEATVQERAVELAGAEPLAVRSSATIEDTATGAAPGLFKSWIGAPPSSVWTYIRTVWASALTPVAASYARTPFDVAVIVQRAVRGKRVTVYTRPPGAPAGDEVWVQRGDTLAKLPRSSADPVVVLALRAEAAIEAAEGADVELVEGDTLWLVQVRSIVHPVPHVRTPPPPTVLAALVADGRTWTWDVAHNPDPLSTAQTGLVERVERAGIAPWSLRVCAGYLYSTPLASPELPQIANRAELDARVAEIETRFAAALAGHPTAPTPLRVVALSAGSNEVRTSSEHGSNDVRAASIGHIPRRRTAIDDAIDRYLAFYTIWATELVPLIRAAKRELSTELLLGARPSAVEVMLLAAARGELDEAGVLERIGVMSPAWDVAVPTFAEDPFTIRHAITRASRALSAAGTASTGAANADPGKLGELARAAADLAERDDVWFARAQWLVRRAILDRASELGLDAADAFWLPLDELATSQVLDLDSSRRRVAAARSAASRAGDWEMPLVVGETELGSTSLVGIGSGGRATGRVVRLASLASRIVVNRTDVVVTRAVTPAVAVIVVGCAALVSETGGPLDHGAAMARELGIPCVVGCRGAWTQLSDGMLVTVDGDTGTVTR